MHEKVSDQQWDRIKKGCCPDCEGQLLVGPRGALALNVACSRCGAAFWVAGPFRPERIGKRPEAIKKEAKNGPY